MIKHFNRPSRDGGFTLVELLVTLIITGFFTLAIGQVMSTATRNVASTMDNTVAPQSAARFINQIRYDVASALSLSAYGTTAPSGSYCSGKLDTALAAGTWTPVGSGAVLRSLVNIRIPTPTTVSGNNWSDLVDTVVGYEVRREAGGIGRELELWRVECQGGAITKQTMQIRLGSLAFTNGLALPYGGGFPDGVDFFTCPGAAPKFVASPTASASPLRLTFLASESLTTTAGEALWLLNMSASGSSAYGAGVAGTGSYVTITPSFVGAVPVTSTSTVSISGSQFLVTRPCTANNSALLSNNAYLVLNVPYLGRVPAVRKSPVVVLKSRLV